jgi:hypothetical protein
MGTNDSFSWGAESLTRSERRQRARGASARGSSLLGARAAAVIIDGFVLLVPVLAVAYLTESGARRVRGRAGDRAL